MQDVHGADDVLDTEKVGAVTTRVFGGDVRATDRHDRAVPHVRRRRRA